MSDENDLGPCCICEGTTGVRNLIMLYVKTQVAGHGWGCGTCDLPCDGASAVLCDPCTEAWKGGTALRFACRGFPAEDGRVPIEELAERHEHDMAKHADPVLHEDDEDEAAVWLFEVEKDP